MEFFISGKFEDTAFFSGEVESHKSYDTVMCDTLKNPSTQISIHDKILRSRNLPFGITTGYNNGNR